MKTELGRVLERLLSGAFICRTSDEEAWRLLKQPAQLARINEQLAVLNRMVCQAAEGEVFYAGYQTLADEERKHLSNQFQEVASQLLPLVEWLLLVQEASSQDSPLTEGMPVRLNELQTVIEDTPAFSEQLSKLARNRLFNSVASAVDGQLKQIFKRLTELGYLQRPNPDKQIYIATGKLDYLYEVIKFIDESEALSLSEQAEQAISQGSLL